jgi:hypothetical protein
MSDQLIQTAQIKILPANENSPAVIKILPPAKAQAEMPKVATPQIVTPKLVAPPLVPETPVEAKTSVAPVRIEPPKAQELKVQDSELPQPKPETGVKFSPSDDTFFHMAMRFRRQDRLDDAIKIVETLHAVYPTHVWLNVRRVDLYMDKKNYHKTIQAALETRKLKLDRNQLNCVRCIQYFCYFFTKQYKLAWPIYMEFLADIKRSVFYDKAKAEHRLIPRWDGKTKGLTIGIVNDEGIGDGIFMARFIAQFEKKGYKTVVLVKPSLIHLYKQFLPNMEIISLQTADLSHIDVWTSCMDIPHYLNVDAEDYTAKTPYIYAKPALVTKWAEKINTKSGLKVGISWQGNPDIDLDKYRSVELEKLKPLSEIAGLRLISLQKGFGEEHLETCSFKDKIETLGEFDQGADAFEDTLAIAKNMDIILTIDSSLAHICGAAHIPVMIMLNAFLASWRWGTDKHNTEWYPFHRMFKQDSTKTWDTVIPAVVHALTVMRDNRKIVLQAKEK